MKCVRFLKLPHPPSLPLLCQSSFSFRFPVFSVSSLAPFAIPTMFSASSTGAWLSFLLASASLSLAAPNSRNIAKRFDRHTVHEARSVLPPGWARNEGPAAAHLVERAAKDAYMLPLRINLAQGGLERGHDILMDISDPESPRYSDHLTAEEVAELVSALPFLGWRRGRPRPTVAALSCFHPAVVPRPALLSESTIQISNNASIPTLDHSSHLLTTWLTTSSLGSPISASMSIERPTTTSPRAPLPSRFPCPMLRISVRFIRLFYAFCDAIGEISNPRR